jgi:hypothetical protein
VERLETRLAPANVDVLTYHYDNFLSGNNTREEILTPANVNSTNFGKLFSQPVDGQIYATPLYKHGVMIGGTSHDVAFVVTEHDSVYAIDIPSDADAPPGAVLWQRSFIDPANGITSVPSADTSGNIFPEYGITGTPVIDGNTMYFVAETKEVRSGTAYYVDKLHAIDITTGQDRTGGRAVVTIGESLNNDNPASFDTDVMFPGGGPGSLGGMVRFNAYRELQRPALTLLGGNVYVGFAGYNDQGPYHGWVIGYQTSDLSLQKVFTPSPEVRGGGIWQSGGGFATDGTFLYFAVGNNFGNVQHPGFNPTEGDYAESVLKLDPRPSGQLLTVADYFTPFNWQMLDSQDLDLGSGGTMLLPDAVGSAAHPHLMVETGKTGRLYLIDRDNMGHNVPPPGPDHVVQILELGGPGIWGNPSFVQTGPSSGLIYYHGSTAVAKAVTITSGVLSYDPNNPATKTNEAFGYPGGQPIISSNGTASAIMWDLRVDTNPGVLHAYDATNLSRELYHSNQTSQRDVLGPGVKFTAPTETNGRVLAESGNNFSVYGLFSPHTTPPAVRTNLMAMGISGTQIQLTWDNPTLNDATGIKIERSPNMGGPFTQIAIVNRNAASFTDTGLSPGTTYYYQIRANNQAGDSPYTGPVAANTLIATPVLTATNVCSCEIDLSWTPSGNSHYKLERAFDDNPFETIADNIPLSQTTYQDMDPILQTQRGTYRYRVTAYNVNPDLQATSTPASVANVPMEIDHSTPFEGGFVTHDDLTANTSPGGRPVFVNGLARLTDAGFNEAGTVFSNNKVNITSFNTTFVFRFSEGTTPRADGITFILQANSPQALGAIGGGLGYAGIHNSVAIKFDLFNNSGDPSEGPPSTGLFTDGRNPTIRQPGLPADVPDISIDLRPFDYALDNQHMHQVTLTYDGSILSERLEDLSDPKVPVFTYDYTLDLRRFIGGDTAYVGFGGGTGGSSAIADIQNWQFTPADVLGDVPPAAPSDLRVTNIGADAVDLAWTCSSTNETGFIIERAPTAGGPFQEIDRTMAPRYTDSGLDAGFYFYRVRAYNDQGNSAPSNTAFAAVGSAALNSVFINHSGGFANHDDLRANFAPATPPRPVFTSGLARLTDGGGSQGGSVWTQTPGTGGRVPVTFFDTTFTLRQVPITGAADGATFTIQNSMDGANALGGLGGGLGYTGISPSVAVYFDLYNGGSHNPRTGLLLNGQGTPGDTRSLAGIINLGSGHPLQVHLTYDSGTLREVVTDTITGAVFSTNYTVNIPMVVGGGGLAYAGFTAATGGESAIQDILNWTGVFASSAPAPYLTVEGFPSPTVAGAAHTFTVTAHRGSGIVNTTYFGTVHFTSSDPEVMSGLQLPDDYTFNSGDNGTHIFAGYLVTPGTQSITATDTVDPSITGTQDGIVVVEPPGTPPAGGGGRSAATFTVTAVDRFGNTTPAYRGTVQVSGSDARPQLPAEYSSTDAEGGVHTSTATLKTEVTRSITATDAANPSIAGTGSGIGLGERGNDRQGPSAPGDGAPSAAFLEPLPMAVAPALASPTQPLTPLTTSASTPTRPVPAFPDAASVQRLFGATEGKDQPLALSRSAQDAGTGLYSNPLSLVLRGLNDSLPYGALVDDLVQARAR